MRCGLETASSHHDFSEAKAAPAPHRTVPYHTIPQQGTAPALTAPARHRGFSQTIHMICSKRKQFRLCRCPEYFFQNLWCARLFGGDFSASTVIVQVYTRSTIIVSWMYLYAVSVSFAVPTLTSHDGLWDDMEPRVWRVHAMSDARSPENHG